MHTGIGTNSTGRTLTSWSFSSRHLEKPHIQMKVKLQIHVEIPIHASVTARLTQYRCVDVITRYRFLRDNVSVKLWRNPCWQNVSCHKTTIQVTRWHYVAWQRAHGDTALHEIDNYQPNHVTSLISAMDNAMIQFVASMAKQNNEWSVLFG